MTLSKRLLAEFLGTAGLLIVVVGSGIMAEALGRSDGAMMLLANSLATGAGLYALIQTFGPFSGAHFNPLVSLVEGLFGRLSGKELIAYCLVQVLGAVMGVWVSHIMFHLPVWQLSTHDRSAYHFLFSEVVATFGLILVIVLTSKKNSAVTPTTVSLYITAAYWCTSSTSFANPAVTIARSLTDTFAGIYWTGVPGFIIAQVCGAALAYFISKRMLKQ